MKATVMILTMIQFGYTSVMIWHMMWEAARRAVPERYSLIWMTITFNAKMPSWKTAPIAEIVNRKAMNDAAEGMVDKRVSRLSMLPDVIDEILKKY